MHSHSFGLPYEVLPPSTWAAKPAASAVAAGTRITITDWNADWWSDGTNWNPLVPTIVAVNTALITGLAQLADQLLIALALPASVLVAGRLFDVYATVAKDGTTDAMGVLTTRMGTAGTTADTALLNATSTTLAAGGRSVGWMFAHRMASATSVEAIGTANAASFPWAGGASGLVAPNAVTIANVTTQTTYFDLTVTMGGTTNKPQVCYCAVVVKP